MTGTPIVKLSEPERWRHYTENLWVSDQGRAKRVYKNGNEYLTGFFDGYHKQVIVQVGNRNRNIKNMVYEAFVGKVPNGCYLVHKNGLKKDNSLYNLEVVSKSENGKRTAHKARSHKVVDLKTRRVYKSARDAGRKLHCSYQMIYNTVNGITKSPQFDLYWWDEDEERYFRGKQNESSSNI